ncbi:MAG: cation:proton antiporter [Phycisphaerales bacterium]|nr:MAG: cation:proton antiporter [Phycisphaerales bacterium]
MDLWTALLDVLIVLLAALLLGALCERLRQSAILGYLLAGTLLGPNALDLMPNHKAVAAIAELGVALLLFTIGLEFSWRKLRTIGSIALGGGTMQVLLTGVLAVGICLSLGLGGRPAVAVGAIVALSGTACVLRLLLNRAEIDGVHGRNALGILLLQDIAVVPLVLVVTALGGEGSITKIGWELGRAVGVALLLVAMLFVLLNYVVPLLLGVEHAARNRDLPILLAIVTGVGTAWISHALGLSPVLGAFIAGLLLAESPFATQIRADIASVRTLFVTLFFSSIGMLCNPAWVLEHWATVAGAVSLIVLGKAVVVTGVARIYRCSPGHAVATGICLAQVGEFSFVLAEVARQGQLIDTGLFELIVASTIGTLFLTPYLVAAAPHVARAVGRLSARRSQALPPQSGPSTEPATKMSGHVVIVGFGPAGQGVAAALAQESQTRVVVVELNAKSADVARAHGLLTYVGDATSVEVLEHLCVGAAKVVVVTVPDPTASRQIFAGVRSLGTQTEIIAQARYHRYRWESALAGAVTVADEEEQVGLQLPSAVRESLYNGMFHT